MNPNREELLFQRALTKPAAERAAWLDRECGDDKALRARLDALLAAHEQPETRLATQSESARSTIKPDFPDAPDEAVGQTLGRCKLLERVGEGGCGVVRLELLEIKAQDGVTRRIHRATFERETVRLTLLLNAARKISALRLATE